MNDNISFMQANTPGINTTQLENFINNAMGGLASTSKEKHEQKAALIENATDMTTVEKLDALDGSYDRHKQEIFEVVVFAFLSLAIFALMGIAVKNPTTIKRVLRLTV